MAHHVTWRQTARARRHAATHPDQGRMTTMPEFRLRRAKALDLVFEGELLAERTSKDEADQERWSEIRIYRTTTGKYVTEQVGRTTIEGEIDRINVVVHERPGTVIQAFRRRRPTGEFFYTITTLEALDEAGSKDPALHATLVERL